MTFWEYLILFLVVLAGGGIAFYIKESNRKILQLVLSFSGAYILGIAVLHLMPGVFAGGDQFVGLWILLGFFIQIFLEQLSGGVEHGHIHPAHHASSGFAIQVMIGLCVHAFMEGMPLENYAEFQSLTLGESHNHNHLLYGVLMHKAPAAFVLVLLLRMSGFKNFVVLTCLMLFAFMSPMGAGLTKWLENMNLLDVNVMKIIVAIVIGSFLHISTTILFEIENLGDHKISIRKLAVIALGLLAASATVL
jgi:zinc and cadmium transporter